MGELKYNAAEVLLYVGLPTGVVLAGYGVRCCRVFYPIDAYFCASPCSW